MDLRQYFETYSINITAFARKVKVSPVTIHNILNGKNIQLKIAAKIEDITKGEVKCRELLPKEILKDPAQTDSQETPKAKTNHKRKEKQTDDSKLT